MSHMDAINWDDYRFVLALHRRGSLAGAARELGVNETTVARRLSQIERSLGVRLFERERGRVRPTDTGTCLAGPLFEVDATLRRLNERVSGADRQAAGTVRVTAAPTIANLVVVPRLPELLGRHERLEVELVVDSALVGIARVRDADVAIRGVRPSSDPDAVTRRLGRMDYGVYCRREWLADGVEPGWIAYEERIGGRLHARWIEEQISAEGSRARTRVNDGETMLRCVLAGIGKTVLAEPIARRFPELQRLDTAAVPPSREFWMLMHPSYRETRRIEVVVEWLDRVVRDVLESSG